MSDIPTRYFDHQQQALEILDQKDPLLFLDYDGTLTPIVATPDLAILSEPMRDVVRRAAGVFKVSVVSGRATDDVRGKVKIQGLFYAGSHGFEIVDPEGGVTVNEAARMIRPRIDAVHAQLSRRVAGIPGALVEHVKYTISAHYRLVSEQDFPKVAAAVEEVLADYPELRKTEGKKVFEIRPRIDWDKGKAVEWILNYLNFDPARQVPIYIGDDTTDEDAFRVLRSQGFGILVAEQARPSAAKFVVKNQEEVRRVLESLLTWKTGRG